MSSNQPAQKAAVPQQDPASQQQAGAAQVMEELELPPLARANLVWRDVMPSNTSLGWRKALVLEVAGNAYGSRGGQLHCKHIELVHFDSVQRTHTIRVLDPEVKVLKFANLYRGKAPQFCSHLHYRPLTPAAAAAAGGVSHDSPPVGHDPAGVPVVSRAYYCRIHSRNCKGDKDIKKAMYLVPRYLEDLPLADPAKPRSPHAVLERWTTRMEGDPTAAPSTHLVITLENGHRILLDPWGDTGEACYVIIGAIHGDVSRLKKLSIVTGQAPEVELGSAAEVGTEPSTSSTEVADEGGGEVVGPPTQRLRCSHPRYSFRRPDGSPADDVAVKTMPKAAVLGVNTGEECALKELRALVNITRQRHNPQAPCDNVAIPLAVAVEDEDPTDYVDAAWWHNETAAANTAADKALKAAVAADSAADAATQAVTAAAAFAGGAGFALAAASAAAAAAQAASTVAIDTAATATSVSATGAVTTAKEPLDAATKAATAAVNAANAAVVAAETAVNGPAKVTSTELEAAKAAVARAAEASAAVADAATVVSTPYVASAPDADVDLKTHTCHFGNVYVVMPYCNEGDMFNFLLDNSASNAARKQGRILLRLTTNDSLRQCFAQIVRGLASIHAQGYVHRDLSLENVLVHRERDGKLSFYVMDFGQCLFLPRSAAVPNPTTTERVCGKAMYISPELFDFERVTSVGHLVPDPNRTQGHYRREPTFGYPADVWTLGVMLLTMLCYKMPWVSSRKEVDPQLPEPHRGNFIRQQWREWYERRNQWMRDAEMGRYAFQACPYPPASMTYGSTLVRDHECISLLRGMLSMAEEKRFTLQQVLDHPYVSSALPPPP